MAKKYNLKRLIRFEIDFAWFVSLIFIGLVSLSYIVNGCINIDKFKAIFLVIAMGIIYHAKQELKREENKK